MAHAGLRVGFAFTMALSALVPRAIGGQAALAIPPDALITLERDGCGGPCPAYSVSIDAGGNVVYEGKQFVRVEGRQTDGIPRSAVAELLETAARVGFFDLQDSYTALKLPDGTLQYTTDLPRSFLSIRVNGRSKRIEDYNGTPEALKQLEARVDELTRAKRWAFLDAPMIDWLRDNGWSPSSGELAALLSTALWRDDVPIVQGLLAFGADPNRPAENDSHPALLVRSAAALRALLAAGADPFTATDDGITLLHVASYLEPEATSLLLRAGVRVDAADFRGGGTPLMEAVRQGNERGVELLLAAGANPATRDGNGRSALELARAIRDSGIDRPDPGLRFRRDRSRVIALVEQALAGAKGTRQQ